MKASTAKPNATTRKKPSAVAILVGIVVTAGLIWGGVTMFNSKSTANYAKDAAKSLEKSLVSGGGVRKCSNGDAGRGSDNRMPWYYAVYEVQGNKDEAAASLSSIAKDNGYTLTDGSAGVNVGDNLLLTDKRSKQSSYSDLVAGNIGLLVDIYASQIHNGKDGYLCGVEKTDSPSNDRTTIRVTVNLPEFKR